MVGLSVDVAAYSHFDTRAIFTYLRTRVAAGRLHLTPYGLQLILSSYNQGTFIKSNA